MGSTFFFLIFLLFLDGNFSTKKIVTLLHGKGVNYKGPFSHLSDAVKAAIADMNSGATLLFSPGCASFEMFRNEFDRGLKFKKLVFEILGVS